MTTTQYAYMVDNNVLPIHNVKTLRELSIWMLTRYLRSERKKYEDTAEYLMELVDDNPLQLSYYEAVPILAHLVNTKFTIRKELGENKLSNHQLKHINFTLCKLIKQELTNYAR